MQLGQKGRSWRAAGVGKCHYGVTVLPSANGINEQAGCDALVLTNESKLQEFLTGCIAAQRIDDGCFPGKSASTATGDCQT